MKRIKSADPGLALVFVIAATTLAFGAWTGSKLAIITLALSNIALALLLIWRSRLAHLLIETAEEIRDHWRIDAEYANLLTVECAQMLLALRETDPEAAQAFEERIQEIWVDQYVAHFPDVGSEILAKASKASSN